GVPRGNGAAPGLHALAVELENPDPRLVAVVAGSDAAAVTRRGHGQRAVPPKSPGATLPADIALGLRADHPRLQSAVERGDAGEATPRAARGGPRHHAFRRSLDAALPSSGARSRKLDAFWRRRLGCVGLPFLGRSRGRRGCAGRTLGPACSLTP